MAFYVRASLGSLNASTRPCGLKIAWSQALRNRCQGKRHVKIMTVARRANACPASRRIAYGCQHRRRRVVCTRGGEAGIRFQGHPASREDTSWTIISDRESLKRMNVCDTGLEPRPCAPHPDHGWPRCPCRKREPGCGLVAPAEPSRLRPSRRFLRGASTSDRL